MEITRNFKKLNKGNVDLAGGKGASLGEMTQAGISVPQGFVVLSEAFEHFIEKTYLVAEIDAALHKVNHDDISTVEDASENIKALILKAEMPKEIEAEILKQFKALGAKFVAVRSSATSEDSSTAAWAGQLESYLNTTEDKVLENVKRCWASLFTPRAIFYRFEKKLHNVKVSVAVVIQKMVESEVSGIAFSVHPVTQDYNQLIIEAGFGLGEAIVSGQITPDSYVVEKQPRRIIDINVSEQEKSLVKAKKGDNTWIELGEKGKKQKLSEKEILNLTELILKIEKHYGFPCDIEWATEKGKFYIVQSRPITTLTEKEGPPKQEPEKKEYKRESDINFNQPKLDLGKKNWEILAKDFNSPFIRNYIFAKGLMRYEESFNVPSPIAGIYSKEGAINYIVDIKDWTISHEALKNLVEKDMFFLEKLIEKTNEIGESINVWTEENLLNRNLTKISNKEIVKLLQEFIDKQSLMYTYGSALPILDFNNFSFIEGNLNKILKEKLNKEDSKEYYIILTEPIRSSFAQDQEEDLFKLILQFQDNKALMQDIKSKSSEEILEKYPNFYNKLREHTKKHCWVYYVYIGPAYTEENFLEMIKSELEQGVDAKKKLENLEKKKKEIKKLRKEYINALKPDKFEKMILELAGKIVWAKPRRKDYQSKSYYHLEKLLSEISKRLKISLQQARCIPPKILEESLDKGKINSNILDEIYKEHACLPNLGKVKILSGKEAMEFYSQYVKKEEIKIEGKNIIKGQTAMQGKAMGIVKIVNRPQEMGKINLGDILVSVATTPAIVPAMKKAAAIVTDEGGLTCHASIVSRELQIPCVVGTKNASQVLKDGMLVEVDANKGVVKILSLRIQDTNKNPSSNSVNYANIDWIPTVTRNMSFWHQYLSSHSLFHNSKDFGVNSNLEVLFITEEGTKTYCFMHPDNLSKYNSAVLEAISSQEKIRDLKERYLQISKSLFSSLEKCKKDLNPKNLENFMKAYTKMCAGLMLTATIGRSGAELLSEKMKKHGIKEDHLASTIATITYPEEHTPLFGSQLSLLKIASKIQNNNLKEKEVEKDLSSWVDKYGSIPVNFCEDPWTMKDARLQLNNFLKGNCKEELERAIENHKNKIREAQELLKKINNSEISLLAKGIAEGTYLNEFRKNVFCEVSLSERSIFEKIAKMAGSNNWRYCFFITPEEMISIVKGEKINLTKLVQKRKFFGSRVTPLGNTEILPEEITKKFMDFSHILQGRIKDNSIQNKEVIETIKGFSANKGMIKGTVKVILSSKEFDKLNRGDILVTTMTSVDFVPIMEKASAFITNEGGITSHASIVAREMNKPCIIGTKIATKVLKDGMLVEVNANQGIVKILKS